MTTLHTIATRMRTILATLGIHEAPAERTLLGTSAKFAKSKAAGLYLPAHLLSAAICPRATSCRHTCISTTGNLGIFHERTMLERAALMAYDPARFLNQLHAEIALAVTKGVTAFRLNGSSDLPFEEHFAPLFPGATFLGYTKVPSRAKGVNNQWIAYSWNESSPVNILCRAKCEGFAVAVVLPRDLHAQLVGAETDEVVFLDGDEGDHLWVGHPELGRKLVLFCLKQKRRTNKGAHDSSAEFMDSWKFIPQLASYV